MQLDLAGKVAERYNIPRVYDSLDELLADPAVDGVTCIQQWPNNYPLVKQILTAGKSVITEKPMVGRLDEAEELTALAASQGVLYAVGFMKRYDYGIERAKQILAEVKSSNELGALLMVDSVCNGGDWTNNIEAPVRVPAPTNLPPLRPTYPDACRTSEDRIRYDWLINIFSHTVNLCHHLVEGEMRVQSASFHHDRALIATLEQDGVPISIRGATSSAHEWREWTTFTFERGEIEIRTPSPMRRQSSAVVTVLKPAAAAGNWVTETHHAQPGWAFFQQARGFVQALAGEAPLRTPASAAVQDVRVMQRIIELAEIH